MQLVSKIEEALGRQGNIPTRPLNKPVHFGPRIPLSGLGPNSVTALIVGPKPRFASLSRLVETDDG